MKEIILHIGMHKTGTSSIQETLQGFNAEGVKYANLGPSNHSVPMVTIFSENRYAYGNHLIHGRTKNEIDKFKEQAESSLIKNLNDSSCEKIIISGEEISYLSEKSVFEMRDFLGNFSGKIKVLAYVRDPIEFSNSALQQMIKGGYKGNAIPQPSYRSRFEKFIKAFGSENVNFRLFKKDKFPQESVVKDFCNWIDLPLNLISEKRTNESVPDEVVGLIYLFNYKGSLSIGDSNLMKSRHDMIQLLSKLFDGKFYLPNSLIKNTLNVDDLLWMGSVSNINFNDGLSVVNDGLVGEFKNLEEYFSAKNKSLNIRKVMYEYLKSEKINFTASDDLVMLLNKLYYKITMSNYKKNLEKEFLSNIDLSSLLRDKAISLEDNDLKKSYFLMRAAQALRPKGEFINRKLLQYSSLVKNQI